MHAIAALAMKDTTAASIAVQARVTQMVSSRPVMDALSSNYSLGNVAFIESMFIDKD